ncbi:MAG TPA: PhzF family phenazine biosynthesis protein [Burkholderiaceae bacterium]|nr:PhzF family phenazine biosynthesis protein [Burkholderiaceae bacterium]
MSRSLPFMQVDVFTARPFLGNPVAVVLDADGLDDATMRRIARWTNLSETTFVQSPTDPLADYALRIFTPDRELPFAGHPTLGSARAVLASGRASARDGRLVQQCAAGRVTLRVDGARQAFEAPPARVAPVSGEHAAELARALGLPGAPRGLESIDIGPVWLVAALDDAATLLALEPDMAALSALSRTLRATGVTLHAPHPPGTRDADGLAPAIAVRSFAPAAGAPEDPVCGSGNACVALQRRARGLREDYVATQGEAIGRAGRIAVSYRGESIEVGGDAVICVEGRIALD